MEKPFYKKWQFWIIVVAVLALIGALTGGNDKPETKKKVSESSTTAVSESTTQTSSEPEKLNMINPDDVKEALKDKGIETSSVEFDGTNKDLIITKKLEDNVSRKARISDAQTDTRKILETVKANDMENIEKVTVNETITLDDSSTVNAYIASFEKSYIESANLKDAVGDILTDNASSYYVHPDFK